MYKIVQNGSQRPNQNGKSTMGENDVNTCVELT